MAEHDDDIGGLFTSFGAAEGDFKELTRKSDAREAQERWPLFKAIAIEKRASPPQLSMLQKKQWEQQRDVPVRAAEPPSAVPGLSRQLAKGLSRFSAPSPVRPAVAAPVHVAAPAPAEQPQMPPAVKPAVRSKPLLAAAAVDVPAAPAPEENVPAPVAARSGFLHKAMPPAQAASPIDAALPKKSRSLHALFAAPAASEPAPAAAPPPRSGGLFGRAQSHAAPAAAKPDALSSLFQRLAADPEPEPVAAPAKRNTLFSRLGKF
jgi:hypothetical protein